MLAYVTRSGYTGEDGFEILVDAAVACANLGRAHGRGQSGLHHAMRAGSEGPPPTGDGFSAIWHRLRWRPDSLETGPGWIIKWDHAFVGREALLRQKEGSFPRLVGIELMGRRIPRQGHPIRADGKIIGKVTSGTLSPILNRGIALGYVTADYAIEGKEVEIGLRNSWVGAKIVTPPFIKKG